MIATLAGFGAAAAYGARVILHAPVVTQSDTECDSCSARKQGQKDLRDALARAKSEVN